MRCRAVLETVSEIKHNRQQHESPIRVPETPSIFIRSHNVMLSVAAMRVSNPNCPPLRING
jgi:hypothetical protein